MPHLQSHPTTMKITTVRHRLPFLGSIQSWRKYPTPLFRQTFTDCFCWGKLLREQLSVLIFTPMTALIPWKLPNFSSTQLGAMNTYEWQRRINESSTPADSRHKIRCCQRRWEGVENADREEERCLQGSTSVTGLSNQRSTAGIHNCRQDNLLYKDSRGHEFKGGVSAFFLYKIRASAMHITEQEVSLLEWHLCKGNPSNGSLTNSPLRITMTPSNMDYFELVHFGLPFVR